MFISEKWLVVVSQGDNTDGLAGPPGRQGEPGDRVGQTKKLNTVFRILIQ